MVRERNYSTKSQNFCEILEYCFRCWEKTLGDCVMEFTMLEMVYPNVA